MFSKFKNFPFTDEQIEVWLILKELQRKCQKTLNMEAHEVIVFTFKFMSLFIVG